MYNTPSERCRDAEIEASGGSGVSGGSSSGGDETRVSGGADAGASGGADAGVSGGADAEASGGADTGARTPARMGEVVVVVSVGRVVVVVRLGLVEFMMVQCHTMTLTLWRALLDKVNSDLHPLMVPHQNAPLKLTYHSLCMGNKPHGGPDHLQFPHQ